MSVPRAARHFWKMTQGKVVEGVFAVNKPTGISSAQVLRDLQHHFQPSELFAPWLQMERAARAREPNNQRKRRREKDVKVKIGHGGTLDPLATGVLITGVGRGTKCLQDFLTCTKEYEAVVLFGTSTDTYDRVGKVLRRAPHDHITKEMVEENLEQFRGKFMQLPPLYSALKMDGKPLYEYARQGKEIPREIERRQVEVLNLELVEWMEGGTHSHEAPTDEAGHAEVNLVNKLWKQEGVMPATGSKKAKNGTRVEDKGDTTSETKSLGASVDEQPSKSNGAASEEVVTEAENRVTPKASQEPEDRAADAKAFDSNQGDVKDVEKDYAVPSTKRSPSEEAEVEAFEHQKRKMRDDQDDLIYTRPPTKSRKANPPSTQETAMMSGGLSDSATTTSCLPTQKGPPAARLRMTVTSGFYVRSLCHDLGIAVGSVALMAELQRTRQGDFEVGKNTLEYADLEKGESAWAEKVEGWLDDWEAKSPSGMRPRGGVARKESLRRGEDEGGEEKMMASRSKAADFGGDGAFDEEKERSRGFVGRDF